MTRTAISATKRAILAIAAIAVLTGRASTFSAGFDLRVAPEGWPAMITAGARLAERIMSFPHPVVAACNGNAIAMAAFVLLSSDYRVGVHGTYRIGLNEVAVGASFPKVAFEIVRLRLPHARASELVLGAALYPASQAVRLGIVDELLPPDAFAATVLRRAARLGAFPREAYAHRDARLRGEACRHPIVECFRGRNGKRDTRDGHRAFRIAGQSKANLNEGLRFFRHLLVLRFGSIASGLINLARPGRRTVPVHEAPAAEVQ